MKGSLILNREKRDALRDAALVELRCASDAFDMDLRRDRLQDAVECRDRIVAASLLLDDLGWEETNARNVYVVSIDHHRSELERLRAQAEHALTCFAEQLGWGWNARDFSYWGDSTEAAADAERLDRENADIDLAVVAVCAGLPDRGEE